MGRFFIFLGLLVVVAAAIFVIAYWLERRRAADGMGMKARGRRINELEAAFAEVREIAASSAGATGDPLWDMVRDLADKALGQQKEGK